MLAPVLMLAPVALMLAPVALMLAPMALMLVYSNSGINSYWIIGNSSKAHRLIDRSNERQNVENIATYDFSTLYTNIPHDKLKKRMENVIRSAYNGHAKKYLSVYNTKASFVSNRKKRN